MQATLRDIRKKGLLAGLLLFLTAAASGGAWQIEMVDQSGTGRYTSLKIDKQGNAHLVYVVDDGKDTLKYAFWDHVLRRWFTEKVAEGASFSSLALDSQQHPHISWADYGTVHGCKLHHAYWDGTSWKVQAIPLAAETVAYYTSIALDANDNPSISYYEYDGPRGTEFRVRMRVVTWTGHNWQVTTADGSNQSGKFNSLAIDTRGMLHLAYANVNAGTAGLRYGVWDGDSWRTEEADGRFGGNLDYVGHGVAMVLDSNGDPHVSYLNSTKPSVRYAVRKNGKWVVEVADRLIGVGYPDRNSIALDERGTPYLSHYDAGLGSLKVAHKEGDKWVSEIVDGNGSGFTSSIQVASGMVWVSYADEGAAGTKVARAAIAPVRNDETVQDTRKVKAPAQQRR